MAAIQIYPKGKFERKQDTFTSQMPLDMIRANDVASELRADLEAMYWMKKAGLWTQILQTAVIDARLKDELDEPPLKYQIGTEWPQFSAVTDLDEATAKTIERCANIMSASPSIDAGLKEMALAINRPVILETAKVEAGWWDRLIGRCKLR